MDRYIFDCEVFRYDWLFVFKSMETGEYTVIHNDCESVKQFITNDKLFGGFNCKFYDNYILKAVLADADNSTVKDINDFIISGRNGWEHPFIRSSRTPFFNTFDLMDDTQQGTSLKSIEAHIGIDIEESSISFDIDRPLTQQELEQTIFYCKYDVDATEKLCHIRKNYLNAKIQLGRMRGIADEVALYCTNAKIVAKYLCAARVERTDGRDYIYPPNLDLDIIPKPILSFFNTIHNKSIPDEVLFKTSFEMDINGCPTKYAWGGVHGSLSCYHEKATATRVIQNRDVASLYPMLMLKYNYISRNIASRDVYEETVKERLAAKKAGDKEKATALKLPLNTASGAAEERYNDLYDPLSARSMRISGQLFLTDLVMHLLEKCKTFKLINFNTDGLIYSIDKVELPLVDEICSEWETRTGFELETDNISRVWVKDVNNLLFEDIHGKVKTVGGYLNYGVQEKGAWSINNNHTVVKDAVIDYFIRGSPIKDTIYGRDNILDFQIIAKASSKYNGAFHLVNGERIAVQKCNRVYAAKNRKYGTIVKVHAVKGNDNKMSGLPENCIIDNRNECTIDQIDKDWYVRLAQKYINDYLGIKPIKPNTRKINSLKKQILKILED